MHPPSLHRCSGTGTTIIHRKNHLGFIRLLASTAGAHSLFLSLSSASIIFPKPSPGKLVSEYQNKPNRGKEKTALKGKNKDNVWSVDNERATKEKERATRRGQKGKRGFARKKRSRGAMVSGAMLMEVETVLQTQEPVIKPVWNTFASSVSGI